MKRKGASGRMEVQEDFKTPTGFGDVEATGDLGRAIMLGGRLKGESEWWRHSGMEAEKSQFSVVCPGLKKEKGVAGGMWD